MSCFTGDYVVEKENFRKAETELTGIKIILCHK